MSKNSNEITTNNPVFSSVNENEHDPPLFDGEERSYFMEQSPYEEVASNVSNHDDPSMLCFTFRSFILGFLFTCILSFTNQFFSFRTSPLRIGIVLVQLLAYPTGRLAATILPTRIFQPFGERYQFSLNPGPFTIKEHCIIATMAGTANSFAMSTEVIVIQQIFYHQTMSYLNGLLFVISSQMLGYGLAGLFRKFLIWPAAMIWPENIMHCALFRILHADNEYNNNDEKLNTSHWKMSRLRFFYLAVLFQFLWYWMPGYIFPILSYFSLICVIFPNNIVISQITGVYGLGLGSFELDWNSWVAFLGSPIVVPLWAQINIFIGFIALVWILTPIGYYSNWWNAKSLPIASYRVFTKEGSLYNISEILDSQLQFNETAYNTYGEIRLPFLFAMTYGIQFAALSAVLVHTIIFDGKRIYKQFQTSLVDTGNDIHAKLMTQYPEVPSWWYLILFIIIFIISTIVCHHAQLMPWYLIILAVCLVTIFILPTGILVALSNVTVGLNVLTEFLAGVIIPGDPIGNVTFKIYGYVSQSQALSFLGNLKLGHYMKIPPRTMFLTQIFGTIIGATINHGTTLYLLKNVPNICTENNPLWKCVHSTTFFSASIIWGVIGPIRLFGSSSIYSPLLWAFLIGAILPIPVKILIKIFPQNVWFRYIHFPVLLSGLASIPAAPPGEYPSWFAVGFLFNFIIFRYAHSWWKRYAFLFSAAMSCGVALCALLIFFIFENNNLSFPEWWGTGGITGDGCPLAHANFSGDLPRYKSL